MSASKRPSTSSLRRFITSRPYVPVAELRRRFGLDEPDAMVHLRHNGTSAWIGLPEREAGKIQDLWDREELGVELSVEVRASVVVGVYPMRIARYVYENGSNGSNGSGASNGDPQPVVDVPAQAETAEAAGNGAGGGRRRRPWDRRPRPDRPVQQHVPRPMKGAPSYGSVTPERSTGD